MRVVASGGLVRLQDLIGLEGDSLESVIVIDGSVHLLLRLLQYHSCYLGGVAKGIKK